MTQPGAKELSKSARFCRSFCMRFFIASCVSIFAIIYVILVAYNTTDYANNAPDGREDIADWLNYAEVIVWIVVALLLVPVLGALIMDPDKTGDLVMLLMCYAWFFFVVTLPFAGAGAVRGSKYLLARDVAAHDAEHKKIPKFARDLAWILIAHAVVSVLASILAVCVLAYNYCKCARECVNGRSQA